jgi:hypothetical protein
VDAAVAHESHEVDAPTGRRDVFERAGDRVVVAERPRLEGVRDPRVRLLDDPPSADVQMADLRVPHLALREPDAPAVYDERSVRAIAGDGVERRGRRGRDRVATRVARRGRLRRFVSGSVL